MKNTIHQTALITLAALFFAAPQLSLAKNATMPKELQGVWYNYDVDGEASCKNYLKKGNNEGNIAGRFQIAAHDFKAYSEYGEGNYYVPQSIKKIAPNTWQVDSLVYLDFGNIGDYKAKFSDEDRGGVSRQIFNLKNRLLVESDASGETVSDPMFRCK
jgi:hypothetical protein